MRLINSNKAISRVDEIPVLTDKNQAFFEGCRYMKKRVLKVLRTAKTIDAVEVVRCAECKLRNQFGCPMYYEEYLEWEEDGYPESDILCHDHTFDDGFCDRGERKDGEG